MQFRNIYTQTFLAFLLSLFLLFTSHLFLLLRYPNDFLELSFSETMISLVMALRVDTITLLTFTGLFILLLSLPFRFVLHRRYRLSFGMLLGVIAASITVFSYANVLYYDFSHRHLSNELFNISDDTNIIIDMALHSFLPYTLGAAAAFFGVLLLYYKLFSAPVKTQTFSNKHWLFFLLIIVLIVLGIRSKIYGKSFGLSDAYAINKVSSGILALNGFFTVYRTVNKKKNMHDLMGLDEAIATSRTMLTSKNAPFVSESYPLMRAYNEKNATKYNVVIVLLESWGAEHIDGFTRYKELNVTPYFKKLSQESLKFTNFYANGYRSIFGITSIYTGLTLPAGFEFLGSGLELSRLSYLGTIAKNNGYSTIAMQGSQRRSYRVDAVSNLAGFDQYYGAQDMPEVEEVEAGRHTITGTYDYNLFSFYHQKLNTMKEPFLGFAFTSTNHSDFHLPSSKFERYPHNLRNYYGALNSYIYVDNAIERFIEGVKKEPWFDRTIFIFTSDHGSGDALNPIGRKLRGMYEKPLSSIEHFRIPLLIYAPKIFAPRELHTLGSQADIMPTLIDLLGFKDNFSAMGNSLLDADVKKRFAYFYGGSIIGLITDEGYIQYNFKNVVGASGTPGAQAQIKKELFAIDTAEAKLLEQNRWSR